MNTNKHIIRLSTVDMEFMQTGIEHDSTILFVHGYGATLEVFEKQHEYFSNEFRVISVNLRGHGKTTIHNNDECEFKFSKMSEDIIELLDSLQIRRVHFVGFSMGGNIGYELLKLNPERLISFAFYGAPGMLKTSLLSVAIMKFFFRFMSPAIIAWQTKNYGQTESSKILITEIMSKISKTTLVKVIPQLSNYDYLDVIRNSTVPAFTIIGEKDKENRLLGSTIREFELRGNFYIHEIKGAGHFANLDNPKNFNKTLHDFINNYN